MNDAAGVVSDGLPFAAANLLRDDQKHCAGGCCPLAKTLTRRIDRTVHLAADHRPQRRSSRGLQASLPAACRT